MATITHGGLNADELLLQIFLYLDIPSLCTACKVCRKWYAIGYDKRLWRCVDLSYTRQPFDLSRLGKFIRSPHTPHLRSLRLEGFLRKFRGGPNAQKHTLTAETLRALSERAVHLAELHVVHADISQLSLSQFPVTICHLNFEGSIFSMNFLAELLDAQVLPALSTLNISNCPGVTSLSSAMKALFTRAPHLQALRMRNCYKVVSEDWNALIESLSNVRVLDLSNNDKNVSDQLLHIIAYKTKMIHLTVLNLSFCKAVTDHGLCTLFSSELIRMNLRECYVNECGITDVSLIQLASVSMVLTILSVVKTAVTAVACMKFSNGQPNCQLICSFTNVRLAELGNGLWWINDDRDN